MNCTQCRELIVLHLYNELAAGTRDEVDAHLAGCPDCAAQYTSMRETLTIMSERKRPSVDESHFATQWETIERQIAHESEENIHPANNNVFKFPARIPAWAYSAAAVLLVAVGIFIGKTFWPTPQEITQQQPAMAVQSSPVRDDSVTTRVLAYLGTSKNLLLGVVNTDQADYSTATLQHQQRISRQLIQQAVYIKSSLTRQDQQQVKQLITDLEVILVQLANIEVNPGVPAIELVKNGVDKKSIILKINVEEIRAMSQSPEIEKPTSHNL